MEIEITCNDAISCINHKVFSVTRQSIKIITNFPASYRCFIFTVLPY